MSASSQAMRSNPARRGDLWTMHFCHDGERASPRGLGVERAVENHQFQAVPPTVGLRSGPERIVEGIQEPVPDDERGDGAFHVGALRMESGCRRLQSDSE